MKRSESASIQRLALSVTAAVSIILIVRCAVHADPIPKGWQASNMKAIGYSDLAGRGGAFKMAIRHVKERWYLSWTGNYQR